jgi:prepilin-type processing-associated H-X9-DG protein
MRDLPQFRCPTNDILASAYTGSGGPNFATGSMVSYNTAIAFLVTRSVGGSGTWGLSTSRPEWNVPSGYSPKVSKVGDPARKIYIADGAKFSAGNASPSVGETPPDADLSFNGVLGGAFSDQGPTKFSRAWNRDRAPTNGGSGIDCRMLWARHGPSNAKPGAASGTFRFNCGFFDGHVETMDDLEGVNPVMWYPKGTELTVNGTQMWNDVFQKFFKGQNATLTVP